MRVILVFLFISILCVAKGQQVIVTAKNGDGIYSLLRNNGIKPSSKSINEFLNLNAPNITKDNHIFIGRKYIIPFLGNTPIDTLEVTRKNR